MSIEYVSEAISAIAASVSAFVALTAVLVGAWYQKKTLLVAKEMNRADRISDQNTAWVENLRQEVSVFCVKIYHNIHTRQCAYDSRRSFPLDEKEQNLTFEVEIIYHRLLLLLSAFPDDSSIKQRIQSLRDADLTNWSKKRDRLIEETAKVTEKALSEVRQ